ncbi:MAG: transcriptional activator RfaH [Proteobacteria bacterium]|nr:transcriptional activator RfaH [Pseudomonadota bacterium]
MTPPPAPWYAVYTQARMESWARSNLWERGFEVYLPLYRKQRRHARKTDWVSAPLFPRYLFVAADPQPRQSRAINTAPGVVGLVAFGERPGVISDRVIQAIRAREDAAGHVRLVDRDSLVPGEQVRLQSGAMADHIGLFERRGDGERVVILLNLLGREVRVKVPASAIARVL